MFLNSMIEQTIQVACLKTNALSDLDTTTVLKQIDKIVESAKSDILRAIQMHQEVSQDVNSSRNGKNASVRRSS